MGVVTVPASPQHLGKLGIPDAAQVLKELLDHHQDVEELHFGCIWSFFDEEWMVSLIQSIGPNIEWPKLHSLVFRVFLTDALASAIVDVFGGRSSVVLKVQFVTAPDSGLEALFSGFPGLARVIIDDIDSAPVSAALSSCSTLTDLTTFLPRPRPGQALELWLTHNAPVTRRLRRLTLHWHRWWSAHDARAWQRGLRQTKALPVLQELSVCSNWSDVAPELQLGDLLGAAPMLASLQARDCLVAADATGPSEQLRSFLAHTLRVSAATWRTLWAPRMASGQLAVQVQQLHLTVADVADATAAAECCSAGGGAQHLIIDLVPQWRWGAPTGGGSASTGGSSVGTWLPPAMLAASRHGVTNLTLDGLVLDKMSEMDRLSAAVKAAALKEVFALGPRCRFEYRWVAATMPRMQEVTVAVQPVKVREAGGLETASAVAAAALEVLRACSPYWKVVSWGSGGGCCEPGLAVVADKVMELLGDDLEDYEDDDGGGGEGGGGEGGGGEGGSEECGGEEGDEKSMSY